MQPTQPRLIQKEENFEFLFSVCTLVTNRAEYDEMRQSFLNAGFTEDVCEYLYIDNSNQNTFEAYAGLNRFLREAKGKYIILCHQDILAHQHRLQDLRDRINEMDRIDPKWAILANAGSINIKYRALHLLQGGIDKDITEKYLPVRMQAVDENFIVVKNEANLALSTDMEGFHFYGADICLVADILGYTAYVIDFKILHKSEGNDDERFYQLKKQFIKKYRRALRSRFMGTTITRFYISGNRFWSAIGNTKLVLFLARQYYKLFKPKRKYHRPL
jgi:hypothetical protein